MSLFFKLFFLVWSKNEAFTHSYEYEGKMDYPIIWIWMEKDSVIHSYEYEWQMNYPNIQSYESEWKTVQLFIRMNMNEK